jgi:SAM-dependent methyltransferase
MLICPCCQQNDILVKESFYRCKCCQHVWQQEKFQVSIDHYYELTNRNALPVDFIQKKNKERLTYLQGYLHQSARVLEMGCAEGTLGYNVKQVFELEYVGIEVSQDRLVAEQVLDQVYDSLENVDVNGKFDFIVSFHVLEHINDVGTVLQQWRQLLKPNGRVIIEVPNRSGHPNYEFDRNIEHVHQFNVSSLVLLLNRYSLDIKNLSTGLFESPSYPDSIRCVASLKESIDEKQQKLANVIRQLLPIPFDIYGVGGDFVNYVEPVLNFLTVSKFFDQIKNGKVNNSTIDVFTVEQNNDRPILISSIRFEREITSDLLALGVKQENIYKLSDILMRAYNGNE